MKTKPFLRNGLLFALAVLAMGYFAYTYPRLYPEGSIHPKIDLNEARTRGNAFIQSMGIDSSVYNLSLTMEGDREVVNYFEKQIGTKRANQLFSDSIPAFYWQFQWRKIKTKSDSVREQDSKEKIEGMLEGDVSLSLDMNGKLIRFQTGRMERDQEAKDSLDRSESASRLAAEKFFNRLEGNRVPEWNYSGMEPKSIPEGMQYLHRWKTRRTVGGRPLVFEVGVTNGRINWYQQYPEMPKPEMKPSRFKKPVETTLGIFIFLFIIVFGFIFLFKRIKKDLLDIKSGWILGLLVSIGWTITFLFSQRHQSGWDLFIGYLVTVPFIGGGAWLVFALGESFTREVWEAKLITSDLLRKRLIFPELGRSLLRGIAFAFLFLGLHSALSDASNHWLGGRFILKENQLSVFGMRFPGLMVLGKCFMESIYFAVVFVLFLLSFFKKYLKKTATLILIAFLFGTTYCLSMPTLSFPHNLFVCGLAGMLAAVFFIQYDWLCLLSGVMLVPLLFYGTALLHAGSGLFEFHGLLLLSTAFLVLVWALVSLRAKPISKDAVRFVPEYVHRIYEKERIQRELEIARNVQLNFLPRIQPRVQGLSVASFCIPAREVGGDYYDFVYLSPKKLGVVIGDVSGKGIPAAFYMTMTKGFFKSQARTLTSPKQVLIHLNSLFYENAERGMFISMIYGVFDLQHRTLTYARAGHNPLIVKRSGRGRVEELSTQGIALGLEAGPQFGKNIQEKKIPLRKGDIFFFYTDGLNEARNRFNEEYGEDRLKKTVQSSEKLSSEDLLKTIQENIHAFSGDVLQHDDMTAVVVKILS